MAPLRKRRSNATADFRVGRERGRDHDQIGAPHRGGGIVGRLVGDVETAYCLQGLGSAGTGDDTRLRAVPAQDASQGRPDQPDSYQRNPIKQGRSLLLAADP